MEKNGEFIKCSCCNTEFYLPKCRLPKDGEFRYCSKECQHKYAIFLTVQKYELKNNIKNMENWLKEKYIDEQLTIRKIMKLLNTKANRTVMEFLSAYNIPIRHGSEAIKTQWIDNEKRRKQTSILAKINFNKKESRHKLKEIMQTKEYREKSSKSKMGELNGMFGRCDELGSMFGRKGVLSPMYGIRGKLNHMYGIRGKLHPNWNPNITDEEREFGRNYPEYKEWRQSVYKRDNYTCQCCGDDKGGNLNAHHMDGYNWCKEKRTDTDNGITLCDSCHKEFHSVHGYRNNTKDQCDKFMQGYYNGELYKFI